MTREWPLLEPRTPIGRAVAYPREVLWLLYFEGQPTQHCVETFYCTAKAPYLSTIVLLFWSWSAVLKLIQILPHVTIQIFVAAYVFFLY